MKKIKDFFATPKRAIVTSVCLVGGLGALTAGSVAVTASVAKNNSIGNIAAEDIALKDAGIDYSQARIHRTEFDFDNGQYLYDVEFSSNGVEYDYRIKASDGTILWRDSEPMDGYAANVNGNQTQGQAQQPSAEQQQAQETLAQAQETLAQAQEAQKQAEAAQKQAQEAAAQAQQQQQQAQEAQKQAEAAQAQETLAQAQEAQKQAEAAQKQAQEAAAQAQQQQQQAQEAQKQAEAAQKQPQQQPAAQTTQQQQPAAQSAPQQPAATAAQPQPAPQPQQPAQNTSYISVDQAKNIALGQAGLSASGVNFGKTKLENDDGRAEYEIEFYSGTTEYDYTIDAVTGNVLEYDVDSIYD